MSFKEIADLILKARRPIDIFGDVSLDEMKKNYKAIVKKCHPDIVRSEDRDMADRITVILNNYYEKALEEFEKGIYNIDDEKELLKASEVLFEFKLKGKEYKFYKYFESEDIDDVYEGIMDDKLVMLKVPMDSNDNDLIAEEYSTLKDLEHLSLPTPITKVKINDKVGMIYEKPNGLSIKEIKEQYGNIPGTHVCWIMERLLSAVGYLHSNLIVHGNIKEENVLINPDNHNVILKDYSLCIRDANQPSSKYKIVNDGYTPAYVNGDARVMPNADIYAVGKIAINLLGGDIKRVALPMNCDPRVRTFIRKLLDPNSNDAWALWTELIQIRNEVYGTERFQKLERKRK